MATTLKANLIIPEVLAAMIDAKLTDKMVFRPLAQVDNTLVGQPGDTIKFPVYAYIGDADKIDENGQIIPVALNQSYVSATVYKTGKGVQITDEAVLSGYGNPMDEIADQLAVAIDNKTDEDMRTSLEGVGASRHHATTSDMSADLVADALTVFGEDADGVKAILVAPKDVATLRKDQDFIRASDIGQKMILSGAIGEIWGCQIIPSNKIKADTTAKEFRRYIVKPGALKLIKKRNAMVEVDREPDYGRSAVYANHHYTTYLYDESKVVMIRQFTDLQTLADGSIVSTAGETANGTLLNIKVPAPEGYKWVYKLGTEAVTNAAFGTALSSYTDWADAETEIDGGATNTNAHVALVDDASKPVKQMNVTLVKKS